jgi:hypothetical protein
VDDDLALLAQGASIVLTTHYLEKPKRWPAVACRQGRLVALGTVDDIRGVVSRGAHHLPERAVPRRRAGPRDRRTQDGGRLQIVARDADDAVAACSPATHAQRPRTQRAGSPKRSTRSPRGSV